MTDGLETWSCDRSIARLGSRDEVHEDFTSVTGWERLVQSLEMQMSEWMGMGKRFEGEDVQGTSANLARERRRAASVSLGTKVMRLEWRRGLEVDMGDDREDGLMAGAIERFFGVRECFFLGPLQKYELVAGDRNQGMALLGAMASAAVASGCTIALILPVGRPENLRFVGRKVDVSPERSLICSFASDFVPYLADSVSHLAGLLEHLQARRDPTLQMDQSLQDMEVTAKFTYLWSQFSLQDSVREIQTIATWPRFRVRELGRDPIAWGLPPRASAKWLMSATFNNLQPSFYPLSARMRKLIDIARYAQTARGQSVSNVGQRPTSDTMFAGGEKSVASGSPKAKRGSVFSNIFHTVADIAVGASDESVYPVIRVLGVAG